MKVIITTLFMLVLGNLYSLELWNGFNEGMTQEQVTGRARQILNITRNITKDTFDYDGVFSLYGYGNGNDPINNFNQIVKITEGYLLLGVKSNLSQYNQSSDMNYNIAFQFKSNRLIAVMVFWSSTAQELVKIGDANYGKNVLKTVYSGIMPSYIHYFYTWTMADKTVVMYAMDFGALSRGLNGITGMTHIYNQKTISEIMTNEKKLLEQKEKERQETADKQRRERLNNTNF